MKICTAFKLIFLSGIILLLLQITSCRKKDHEFYPKPSSSRTLEVWLHRVDNIDKAQHFQYSYTGFELDVHFDTAIGTFMVKHDFEDTTHLLFTTWLSSLDDPGRLGLWLDFKNLSMDMRFAAQKELIRIRNEFNLKRHPIVVECCNPDCLAPFDTLNFRPSFYLPTFDPDTLTEAEEQSYKNWISSYISKDHIQTISAYYFQHSFMKNWYPSLNKLVWYLDSTDPVVKDSIISQARKDTTIEVMLVAEDYTGTLKLSPQEVMNSSTKRKLIK
ncbi:MAG: hypothetical protein Q8867_03305 [Bacteroidota bacterium]|nr:hypothetical protein [Bacteroidota bacterium]